MSILRWNTKLLISFVSYCPVDYITFGASFDLGQIEDTNLRKAYGYNNVNVNWKVELNV